MGGNVGNSGDGGAATSAQLNTPYGATVDSSGNMYITDYGNHRIRKVTKSSGIITTYAGSTYGNSGDGGYATAAQLRYPFCVALSTSGIVYIADTYNYKIRMVSSAGIITTVAGTGAAGSPGASNGDGGPATSAQFNLPRSVGIDTSGNMYIADTDDHKIRKVSSSSGIITTYAGTGGCGVSGDGSAASLAYLCYPYSLAVSASGGYVYIADTANNKIRQVNSAGIISTYAGTGTAGAGGDGGYATSAQLSNPQGVAVDSSSNVYIADTNNNKIRVVYGNINTISGTGVQGFFGDGSSATSAQFFGPNSVFVDSSFNIYIADSGNQAIRMLFQPQPSAMPSIKPTQPSSQPSMQPSSQPSTQPSRQPTMRPSCQPSQQPTQQPSSRPTRPSSQPSMQPSAQPSRHPTMQPSSQPSQQPTQQPSSQPSKPSSQPSMQPSAQPSRQPRQVNEWIFCHNH